jgi:hypothetical protein
MIKKALKFQFQYLNKGSTNTDFIDFYKINWEKLWTIFSTEFSFQVL